MIGEEINKNKLEDYLSKIDYSKNAWESESLSQLIDLYNYYENGKSLKQILKEIKETIEKI